MLLQAYKNGVKCAIATQVAWVQWHNFAGADCGGGPEFHTINGKDHNGIFEMTWIVDDRVRTRTAPRDMAGIFNALVVAESAEVCATDVCRSDCPDSVLYLL